MFVDATECVMQVIEHRVSGIQHRSFDGNYFASNCNADLIEFMVTVGMPVTRHPPYRSRRALLTHRAPTSGADVQLKIRIWMHHTDFGQPSVD